MTTEHIITLHQEIREAQARVDALVMRRSLAIDDAMTLGGLSARQVATDLDVSTSRLYAMRRQGMPTTEQPALSQDAVIAPGERDGETIAITGDTITWGALIEQADGLVNLRPSGDWHLIRDWQGHNDLGHAWTVEAALRAELNQRAPHLMWKRVGDQPDDKRPMSGISEWWHLVTAERLVNALGYGTTVTLP